MGISMKSTSGKILASVALVGTAAAVAGLGTFGEFSDSTTADQKVTAGTVNIDLTSPTTLATQITGMLPGDQVQKLATITNMGDSNFSGVTLTTKLPDVATPTLLTSDPTHGLKLNVERCAPGWAVTAGSYSCAVKPELLVDAVSAGNGQTIDLGVSLASLNSKGSDSLKITTTLPSTAGNDFQGLSTTVNFTFTATQRTATTS